MCDAMCNEALYSHFACLSSPSSLFVIWFKTHDFLSHINDGNRKKEAIVSLDPLLHPRSHKS